VAQIFHPAFNTISRVSLFGGAFFAALLATAWGILLRSPYATRAEVVLEQPVPFSHEHHVGGLGIDCRYCHAAAEQGAFAGLPATKTCMTCHATVFTDAPLLEPVRASFRDDTPIPWVRVHDLPDFVYFDHSIHLAKGIACATCHGRVDRMPLAWREHSLSMEWCLGCHRDPERFVRPPEQVFAAAPPAPPPPEERSALARALHLSSKTDCSTCHR